jgi:hypothetical protein
MNRQSEHRPAASRFKHPIGPRVHEILWREWDPIGVNEIGPDDEYDGYVRPIIGKVMSGETVEQIADYLDWAVGDHMGLSVIRCQSFEIAQKLCELRPSESEA